MYCLDQNMIISITLQQNLNLQLDLLTRPPSPMLTRSWTLKSDILNLITCPNSSSKESSKVTLLLSSDCIGVEFVLDKADILGLCVHLEWSPLPMNGTDVGLISLVDELKLKIGTLTLSRLEHKPIPRNAIVIQPKKTPTNNKNYISAQKTPNSIHCSTAKKTWEQNAMQI